MRTVDFICDRDVAVRSKGPSWGDTPLEGAPKRSTLYAGKLDNRLHRSFLHFAPDWSDIGTITKAELVLHTSFADYGAPGTNARARIVRLSSGWGERSNHTAFDVDSAVDPHMYTAVSWYGLINRGIDQESRIDITSLVGRWAPKSKGYRSAGQWVAGGDVENEGLAVLAVEQTMRQWAFQFHSDEAGTPAFFPYIHVEYDPPNYPPDLVTAIDPQVTGYAKGLPFTGEFVDPNGDPPDGIMIRVERVSDGHEVYKSGKYPFQGTWTESGGIWSWSVPAPPSDKVKTNVSYRWQAIGWDPHNKTPVDSSGDPKWSNFKTFTRNGTVPTLTTVASSVSGSLPTLQGHRFMAIWTVESGEQIVTARIRVRRQGDPWDLALWDQFFAPMTQEEENWHQVRREYEGAYLAPDTYVWQAQVTDSQGLSAWSDERTFTLTTGSEVDDDGDGLGPPANVTGYARAAASVRVVLRKADAADRGPGTVVAIIEDPTNLGFRTVYNAPGEMYFTLPATHPQAGMCEPWQTHYAVQQYRNGGWIDLANGWLSDFDAGDNDIVIYGLDYLGALSKQVDPRFPEDKHPDATIANGGARYPNMSVTDIIKDQLDQSRLAEDSNVGFIYRGNIDPLPTNITIYVAFKQRLDFIRGVIDSHKQGSGKRTRLKPRYNRSTHRWEWDVREHVGVDRDNMRMEYGSLLQNFRVVAMGTDWATKVHVVATRPNEVRPIYKAVPSGSDFWTDTFGLSQTTALIADISDDNDLARRVKQMRAEAARIGKQVWIAIRVHGLDPFDGYDLMDNIPLDIDRGMVETERYGSGYWTLHGVEWRLFPDGHDELSLIIRPRIDLSTPDPDLLPSNPIHADTEWSVGAGPPVADVSFNPASQFYYDQTTGKLYERDPNDPTVWTEQGLLQGATGATGPPGPAGGADTHAPAAPTALVGPSTAEFRPDGHIVTSIDFEWTAPTLNDDGSTLGDLSYYELQWDVVNTFTKPSARNATQTTYHWEPVTAGRTYYARVRAVDKSNNRSVWSSTATIIPTADPYLPEVPDDLELTPGYKLVGASWARPEVADLDRFEVRYTVAQAVDTPNTANWKTVSTKGTSIVITSLTPNVQWFFQLRTVSTAGKTRTSISVATPVMANSNPEAGWSAMENATPNLIGSADIAANAITANHIAAGAISADMITSGTISVGGAGRPASIEMFDARGEFIGRWDSEGLLVVDPDEAGHALWLAAGELKVTNALVGDSNKVNNPTFSINDTPVTAWLNSVTSDGINASALTFGINPGGHNSLPNAGFELTAFVFATTKIWTAAADWGTAAGLVNMTLTGADLTLTTATY